MRLHAHPVTAVTAFSKCRYQKLLTGQRGNGITGSNGIPLYLRARARTHTIRFACYACYAVTRLIYRWFLVTASEICRYCRYQLEGAA